MKDGKCLICKLMTVIVSIGAINWGTVAFFQMDLVAKAFGMGSQLSHIVYGVVGVAGVIKLLSTFVPFCPCMKKDGSCAK